MADMRFIDKKLRARFYPYGLRLDDRFVIIKRESCWLDSSVYRVKDTQYDMDCSLYMIGSSVDNGQRANAHVQFLETCKTVDGFPKLIHRFVREEYDHIVTTCHGDDFYAVLSRSVFKVSQKNSVRLAYHLFKAISKIHKLGYVHRNIRTNTVRGGLDEWGENFIIHIDNFFYSAPIEPNPSSYGMDDWATQSLEVNLGEPYTMIDDYVSGLLVVMESQDIRPFLTLAVNKENMIGAKADFDENPKTVITRDEDKWMAELYEAFKRQRVAGINLDEIWTILNGAVSNCVPSSKFDWMLLPTGSSLKGEVKLKGEEINIPEPTPDQTKKPITVPQ